MRCPALTEYEVRSATSWAQQGWQCMVPERLRQTTRRFVPDMDWFGGAELALDPDLACEHPLLIRALELWRDARGARRMPARRDVDPTTLPRDLIGNILLIDVEHEPVRRFRWRLIGTEVTRRMGRDSTGRYWDELYDAKTLDWFAKGPEWVLTHRRPLRLAGKVPVESRDFMRSESIDLPLSDDGENVTMIWVVSTFS